MSVNSAEIKTAPKNSRTADIYIFFSHAGRQIQRMAPSRLMPERAKVLAEIMAIQKKYRANWRDSLIQPVGSRPDGKSITGFYADSGYLLVFREKDAAPSAKLDLPQFECAEVLYATAQTMLTADGTITMQAPGSAALLRLK